MRKAKLVLWSSLSLLLQSADVAALPPAADSSAGLAGVLAPDPVRVIKAEYFHSSWTEAYIEHVSAGAGYGAPAPYSNFVAPHGRVNGLAFTLNQPDIASRLQASPEDLVVVEVQKKPDRWTPLAHETMVKGTTIVLGFPQDLPVRQWIRVTIRGQYLAGLDGEIPAVGLNDHAPGSTLPSGNGVASGTTLDDFRYRFTVNPGDMQRTDKDAVDSNDLLVFRGRPIGVQLGSAEYSPIADFDGNGTNDVIDAINFLRAYYGKSFK